MSEEKYLVITNSEDGEPSAYLLSEEELLKELNQNYEGGLFDGKEFLEKLPGDDGCHIYDLGGTWDPDKVLIFKGVSVIPKPKTVVKEYGI